MSRTLTLIDAQAPPVLTAFASALVSKATRGGITTVTAPTSSAPTSATRQIVVGPSSPAGVHTVITRSAQQGLYRSVTTTLVRAILGPLEGSSLAPCEALDTIASVGAPYEDVRASLAKALKRSFPIVEREAQRLGATEVTLVMKPSKRYALLRVLYTETLAELIATSAVLKSSSVLTTAEAANKAILFPETVPLMFLADVPTCESVELAFAGVTGGAARWFAADGGNEVAGGYSATSVARAVAAALAADGMAPEAAAIDSALTTARREKAILASFK